MRRPCAQMRGILTDPVGQEIPSAHASSRQAVQELTTSLPWPLLRDRQFRLSQRQGPRVLQQATLQLP